ncbi:MAG: TetR/AcrR family transcriptional regulator [Anaerolineae bacterium]|nr:TetR/AcrR family transcriptional regulator [Anaerolineae bacterium]
MTEPSEARERVLQAAAKLFSARGYNAVTVKDIASEAGIHHASLYHHAPNGKEGLFVEVTARTLTQHRDGIAAAVAQYNPDLRRQLSAIAAWLIDQPPLDMIRLIYSDLPAVKPDSAEYLTLLAFESMLVPVAQVLEEASVRGEIAHHDLGSIAGALFSSIESLHTLPDAYLTRPRQAMAEDIIDVFIAGMTPR